MANFKSSPLSLGTIFTTVCLLFHCFLDTVHSKRNNSKIIRIEKEEGESMELHCEMKRSVASHFSWYKNNSRLYSHGVTDIDFNYTTESISSVVAINNLSATHNAEYACLAANGKRLISYIIVVQPLRCPALSEECNVQTYCRNDGLCCNDTGGIEYCRCRPGYFGRRCDEFVRGVETVKTDGLDRAGAAKIVTVFSVVGSGVLLLAVAVYICRKSSSDDKDIVRCDDEEEIDGSSLTGCHVEEQHQFRRSTESKSPLLLKPKTTSYVI